MTVTPGKKPGDTPAGTFAIQFCPVCARYIFYPRELCPYCLKTTPEIRHATGRGKVYSYTVVRVSALEAFEDKVPYIFAIVELDEGLRIPSNIVECPIEEMEVDMPVELLWHEEGGKRMPLFRPVREESNF